MHVQFQSAKAIPYRRERDVSLPSSQGGAKAKVDPRPESYVTVRFTAKVKDIGIVKDCRVPVRTHQNRYD